jgi:hypothetical protein
MDNIIEPTLDFDFSKLQLSSPTSLAGGAYFTRIFLNSKPVYVQTPKSLTKQGFIKSSKKIYTDLMFDNNDSLFINWLENLETKCHELITQKGSEWFESPLEPNDIETAFTSPIKIFKSGKYYLVRVNVKQNIKIYDEVNEIINLERITSDTHIISILEIQGIKFTSRNFQIEMELKQTMIVSPDPFLDKCFIKKPALSSSNSNSKSSPIFKENNIPEVNEYVDNLDIKKDNSNIANNTSEYILDNCNNNINLSQEVELVHLDDVEDYNQLEEVDLATPDNSQAIMLKKPNQVYYNLYKNAKEKAKQAKKEAIIAYLEAKSIKKTYLLDDIEDSDSDNELNNMNQYSVSELEKEL